METGHIILKEKSFRFAVEIVNIYKHIVINEKEFILSKQCLKSGTSIGAIVFESLYSNSKADFISKLSIGLKEANETNYWLRLLKETNYINNDLYVSTLLRCEELIRLLTSSINALKKNSNKNSKKQYQMTNN